MAKIISIPLAIILSIFSLIFPAKSDKVDAEKWNTNYPYIFVHGLMGWGSYDPQYKIMPYWGMFGGELLGKLEKQGFDCYAASVAPSDSAWDRACELYAQLTGTVTDYGAEHSERCGHERFGKDFTGKALIEKWDAENKINLLGHSFGGATIRVFASLMAQGSKAEMEATGSETSPFFTGGKEDWIYSLTSLAAPHNGTSTYNVGEDPSTPAVYENDGAKDNASYDMYIDNALELNKTIVTSEESYYFSFACTATDKNEDGTYTADNKLMEILFRSSSNQMGKYTGVTKGGYVIDESWLENDGLVNTVSALAPSSAPTTVYEAGNVSKGVWNIMPVYRGDHMSLQGGLLKVNDNVKDFYIEHLNMINCL